MDGFNVDEFYVSPFSISYSLLSSSLWMLVWFFQFSVSIKTVIFSHPVFNTFNKICFRSIKLSSPRCNLPLSALRSSVDLRNCTPDLGSAVLMDFGW